MSRILEIDRGSIRLRRSLCYAAPVAEQGDSSELPAVSTARLFEDGQELGPSHTLHAEIENQGQGRFSHWENSLLFSTSDGSSPMTNGRAYQILIEPKFERGGLGRALRANLQMSQSEMHCLLCWKLFSASGAARHASRFGRVLEIGSYSHPGLALLMLLINADHVTLNNQYPIKNFLTAEYVENVVALTAAYAATKDSWRDMLDSVDGGYRIKPERLATIEKTDAADMGVESGSIDLVYSLSVLEHIRHLGAVMREMARLIKPGGYMWHWIDVRDHTSMGDPLKYLRLSEEEFSRTYSDDNVRSRPSKYIETIESAGFEILNTQFTSFNPIKDGISDLLPFIVEPASAFLSSTIAQVPTVVTEADRANLHPDFQNYSLSELSVSSVSVLARRK